MAKGNNGNLLQHYVECELASLLTESMLQKRIHVVFTHGMAPFETFEELPKGEPGDLRRLLAGLETMDVDRVEPAGYPVFTAYKRLEATDRHYPNSAELVASIVGGRPAISGEICESDPALSAALKDAWEGTRMDVRQSSWRDAVRQYLRAPADLQCPWLFSMDPYSFRKRDFMEIQDDGDLDQHDMQSLKEVVAGFFNSGQRGALCIMSYKMQADEALEFESALIEFCRGLGDEVDFEVSNFFVSTPSRDGAEHIAALIAEDSGLIEKVKAKWKGCLEAIRIIAGPPEE